MEFQSKQKVSCLGCHVPTLPKPIKQGFHSVTQASPEWRLRNGGESMHCTDAGILAVLCLSWGERHSQGQVRNQAAGRTEHSVCLKVADTKELHPSPDK